MNTKLETLIASSKIKPIGYAQMQPLLTYEPTVPMYSTKGESENGYEMVSLYSADQVGWILEEVLRQADQQPFGYIGADAYTLISGGEQVTCTFSPVKVCDDDVPLFAPASQHERSQRVIAAAEKMRDAAVRFGDSTTFSLNEAVAEYDKANKS